MNELINKESIEPVVQVDLDTKKNPPEKNKKITLFKTRAIIISGAVDSKLASEVITNILALEEDNAKKKITLYINSPGGEIYSGFAIFDTLKFVSCPITTIVVGLAASMGSILSLAADSGQKFALPHARIMIHQPLLGNLYAPATDIQIQSTEIQKTKKEIALLYSKATGKKFDAILNDIDRDFWFTAKEALNYGLLDKIVTSSNELK